MNAQSVLLYMGNVDLSKESLTISQRTWNIYFCECTFILNFLTRKD